MRGTGFLPTSGNISPLLLEELRKEVAALRSCSAYNEPSMNVKELGNWLLSIVVVVSLCFHMLHFQAAPAMHRSGLSHPRLVSFIGASQAQLFV